MEDNIIILENEDNTIISENRNKYKLINKCCNMFIVFLYILLLEFVVYLFVKTVFYIINKIKKIKR
jgi:hypothetical protein